MRFQPRHPTLRARLRFGVASIFAFALTTFAMPGRAIEEPDYQVVREIAGAEVRQYPAYTVAEVVVAGPADVAGKQAFPVLADYLFGNNRGDRKLAMTAPVTQVAVPAKLPMTAPVTQSETATGYVVQFVLPKGMTAASAPQPVDPRVRLRDVAPTRVAVIRYSGFWSDANYDEHLVKLQDALRTAGLQWAGDPIYARYDAPFVPWFMRRNEIWLNVPG